MSWLQHQMCDRCGYMSWWYEWNVYSMSMPILFFMYLTLSGFPIGKLFVICFHPCLFNLIQGCHVPSGTYSYIFFVVLASCYNPLLGCTRSWGRCWVANQLSHHLELSCCVVHGEVNGLDIGRPGQRFVLLRHTQVAEGTIAHLCKQE